MADPVGEEYRIHMAARDAAVLLDRDPELASERDRAARTMLRRFGRTDAVRTRNSG